MSNSTSSNYVNKAISAELLALESVVELLAHLPTANEHLVPLRPVADIHVPAHSSIYKFSLVGSRIYTDNRSF